MNFWRGKCAKQGFKCVILKGKDFGKLAISIRKEFEKKSVEILTFTHFRSQ